MIIQKHSFIVTDVIYARRDQMKAMADMPMN